MATILVADATTAVVTTLCTTLMRAGHSVVVALRGDVAWQLIQTTPPDLLILDAHLPGLTGRQLWQRMQATPGLQQLPIILLDDAAAPAGTPPHAAVTLPKPIDRSVLLDHLVRLLPPAGQHHSSTPASATEEQAVRQHGA